MQAAKGTSNDHSDRQGEPVDRHDKQFRAEELTTSRQNPIRIQAVSDATTEPEARMRRRWLWWWMFALYLTALLLASLITRRPGSSSSASLWDLQNTRLLLEWISDKARSGIFEMVRFIPVGFLSLLGVSTLRPGSVRCRHSLFIGSIGLSVAGIAMVLVHAIESGMPAPSDAAVVFLLPVLGCTLGTWIGLSWLRGPRARLVIPAKLAALALLVLGGSAVAGYLAIENSQLDFVPSRVASDDKRRLVDLIQAKDPRDIETGDQETLSLSKEDLNLLLSWAASIGSDGRKAAVTLEHGSVTLSCSLRLPEQGAGNRFLNVTIAGEPQLKEGRLMLRKPRLTIGRLSAPKWLAAILAQWATRELANDRHMGPLVEAVQAIEIRPELASITYRRVELPGGYFAQLLDRLSPAGNVRGSARVYAKRLVSVVGQLPAGDARFGACMEETFRLARERSHDGDPVLENRAAILALATVMGHHRVQSLVGPLLPAGMPPEARYAFSQVTLRGRDDWVKHFLVSAALALISNQLTSDAAGLLKEELDAGRGRSGFSFSDLLADRAGTTFAIVATRDAPSARQLQHRIATGFRIDDFFPHADDLPEGIHDADLQDQYGGVGGERYCQIVEEIERRIANCSAY